MIVEKNKKQKKQNLLEPVPQLDPIVQNADQSWSIMKNMKLAFINLSVNKLGDDQKDSIEAFMNSQMDKFVLVLSNNQLTEKSKEKLKKKFNKRIHL